MPADFIKSKPNSFLSAALLKSSTAENLIINTIAAQANAAAVKKDNTAVIKLKIRLFIIIKFRF